MVQTYKEQISIHVSALYNTERANISWELDAMPNATVQGDMGWDLPAHRQWRTVTRHWCHLVNMEHTRLNKHIFLCSFTWPVELVDGLKTGALWLENYK